MSKAGPLRADRGYAPNGARHSSQFMSRDSRTAQSNGQALEEIAQDLVTAGPEMLVPGLAKQG